MGGNSPPQANAGSKVFGDILLSLLVAQNTSATLLARYTRTKYNYDLNQMFLVAELMKFVASMVLEFMTAAKAHTAPKTKASAFLLSFRENIWENPKDALKLTIPAGLYLVQNSLVYYSISRVPVPLFQITQQTKLVTTALLSIAVLRKSYNCTQWYSILSLCIGAAVCILSSAGTTSNSESEMKNSSSALSLSSTAFGLFLILLSNFSSSIASVYFEIVIKGKEPSKKVTPSIWMRNIQMAFFTICIITFKMMTEKKEESVELFYDFTPLLWFQISIFAFGGLLVASVIKYTDSVQKGLATGLSVVSSSALSMIIECNTSGFLLNFLFGSILAIGGCFFFANPNFSMGSISIRETWGGPNDISVRRNVGLTRWRTRLAAFAMAFFALLCNEIFVQHVKVGLSASLQGSDFDINPVAGVNYFHVPDDWKENLHIHVVTYGPVQRNCGGCKVLHELADALKHFNISASKRDGCPLNKQLENAGKGIVAIIYPEVINYTCNGPGIGAHARWILAPLGRIKFTKVDSYKDWGEEDLIFNFATSTAVNPSLLPMSNILQLITNPIPGDVYDLPADIFNKTNRRGTAWVLRKGESWHPKIDFIHERLPEPRVELDNPTPEDLLKYEYFVSYDPYTFFSYGAAMSGAISIVHPIENVTKHDWVVGTYVGEYIKIYGCDVPGIAYGWGDDEIEYA